MRRLYFCAEEGGRLLRSENFADDFLVPTNIGGIRADDLQASSEASLVVAGAVDDDGKVTYTSFHGGADGNRFFVEHTVGNVGAGHENRATSMTLDAADENGLAIVVVFGTDNSGVSIVPTAQQVVGLLNGNPELAKVASAVAGGSGDGDVALLEPTYMGGGADNGDWRKFNDLWGTCRRINTVKVV